MKSKQDKLNNLLLDVPEWLLILCVFALVAEEFLRSTLGVSFLTSESKDLRVSIGIAVITLLVISMRLEFRGLRNAISKNENKLLGVLEVLHAHESIDFKELLESSDEIRILSLSGTKAASLGDGRVQELLCDPGRKSKITILLANPKSLAIETRYSKDEPESFEAGIEGISRRLLWLDRVLSEMPASGKKKIEIRVYDNYPVVSIVQADSDIYSTTYGFRLRGGDCPKVHSLMDGDYGIFLLKHFQKVYEEATPLSVWVSENSEQKLEEV